jgi:HK97 family phage portal protein
MGLARRLKQAGPGPNPETTFRYRYPFWAARTDSGEIVSVEDSLTLDVVWAAIRLRAWGVGQLPLRTYRRIGDDERVGAQSPTTRVLRKPNREHSSINCWSLVSTHLNSWGNSYIGKTFDLLRPNVVKELWPWHPKYVRPARLNGEKLFFIRDPETGKEDPTPYTRSEFIHVMGFSLDGLEGLSPVGMARESIGSMRARQRYGNKLWANSAIPSGLLSTEAELGEAGRRQLERDWNRKYRGGRNARRTAVLENGLKFQALSLPLNDAQFIESEQFSVQTGARWFGIAPSLIGGSSGDPLSYKNLEAELLRHLILSLQPELVLIEQALEGDLDLFPIKAGAPEPIEFPEFKVDAMLRADTRSRYEANAIANGGRAWELPSEQRRRENLPPIEGIDDPTKNPPKGVSTTPRVTESE